MSLEAVLKRQLMSTIDSILEDKNQFLRNPATDFSRKRKISFHETMLFPMIAGNENTSIEMLDFFPSNSLPSPAALSYRRDQIKPNAFRELFLRFTKASCGSKKLKGLCVIASDGSRLNTPHNEKDLDSFLQCIKQRRGNNHYHLTTFYDLLNECYIDAVIQGGNSMHEQSAFCQMIDRYDHNVPSLFIADRGYASFNLMAHVHHQNQYYLFRLPARMASKLLPDDALDLTQECIDVESVIHIGRKSRRNNAPRNYHYVPTKRTYDYLPPKTTDTDLLPVRLLKFPLSEDSYEFIVTNLPADQFSMDDIKRLYGMRWGIETSFRYLKYAEGLVHMHSIKPAFIEQEIYAKLTAYNFCSALAQKLNCRNRKQHKHKYVIDKTYLIKVCIRYLKGHISDIQSVLQHKKVPVRPGRKFERHLNRKSADTLQYR